MFSATKGGSTAGYQISRSVRLRSSASAYLNRTNATPTSATTWTLSFWIKRGSNIGTQQNVSGAGQSSGTNYFTCTFNADSTLNISDVASGGTGWNVITTQVFRDPSAWYHFVIAYDSTQATASNRIKLYVNGSQVTAFSSASYPTLNFVSAYNANAFIKVIGNIWFNGAPGGFYFDGYLTEINNIDGQALTPSSFGQTNYITGVWSPIKYTGTYGTNGFYLNFSDNSGATATTIGKDYSGNGNNWTPNNISVTAGVTYDSMLDVPTQWADGGNGRGNYCVWNPIAAYAFSPNLTAGNLNSNPAAGSALGDNLIATMAVTSGSWYWEITPTQLATPGGYVLYVGISTGGLPNDNSYIAYQSDGQKIIGGSVSSYGSSYTTNDVIGVALDMAAQTVTFYKNNVSQGAISTSSTIIWPMVRNIRSTTTSTAYIGNFGQRPFAYTPPTGFRALNTLNLPTPTILKGNQFMDVVTRNGFGTSGGSVTSLQFQPDALWTKGRGPSTSDHYIMDSVRGSTRTLSPNQNTAEQTFANWVTSFNSNGYTLGSSDWATNQTIVDWTWKANGTPAVTNTAGSITSTISSGTTQGFSIATYTGTGANATVGHGLGVAPSMIIVKRRDAAGNNWNVYHASIGNTTSLLLNDIAAQQAASAVYWNNTSPTSSVFTLGTGGNGNFLNATYVAYLFSEVAGFSRFRSYTGNGSADGPFVFCGFRPRWVMFKRADGASAWTMYDTARDLFNPEQNYLQAQSSAVEAAAVTFDILANGFKIRTAGDPNVNGGTYIFAAFAENPFKNALAR